MHCRPKWIVLLLGLVMAFPGCSDDDGFGSDDGRNVPLARGLDITAVALYQGLKIPLMENFAEVTERPVEVVQGRDALLRVFVKFQEEWVNRTIVARVDFQSELTEVETLEVEFQPDKNAAEFQPDGQSVDEFLKTTFNIPIPGEYFAGDLALAVSLREAEESEEELLGSSDKAAWPTEGYYSLAQEVGGPMEIYFVPIRYNADNSGRLPDTSEEQIQLYTDMMYSMYPVDDVIVTVGEPFDWGQTLGSMGNGWSQLLTRLQKYRNEAGLTKKQYLYAGIAPANNMMAFCGMGCVAGLSNLATTANAAWARVSLGLGFTGEQSATTMVHEVGHAHGREHAPCGLQGQPSDPKYPYQGAKTGVWGYDLTNGILMNPEKVKDFMSYCSPIWMSDYTYNGLYTRVKAVNALPFIYHPQQARIWHSLIIDYDGSVRAGPDFELDTLPGGEPRDLELLDANGSVVDNLTGYFSPYSSVSGGLVMFPASHVHIDASVVRLPGYPQVVVAPNIAE